MENVPVVALKRRRTRRGLELDEADAAGEVLVGCFVALADLLEGVRT